MDEQRDFRTVNRSYIKVVKIIFRDRGLARPKLDARGPISFSRLKLSQFFYLLPIYYSYITPSTIATGQLASINKEAIALETVESTCPICLNNLKLQPKSRF